MKGSVQVYKNFGLSNQELICQEDNLLVDGAAENICTLLTMPSSVAEAVPKLLDSSNFTIQAISFGKGSNAYKENAHFFPLYVSSWADGFPSLGKYYQYVSNVKTDLRVRAVSLQNENVAITTSSYDPKRDPGLWPRPIDTQLEPETETAIDIVSGQFHRMGDSVMQGRAHAYGHNLNRLASNTNPNLISFTDGPPTDPNCNLSITPQAADSSAFWVRAGLTIEAAKINLQPLHSGPFYGTSSFLVSAMGGYTYGNRNKLQHNFPSGTAYFHENIDHTLSMYVRLPKVNAASSLTINIKDNAGSLEGHIATFLFYDTTTSSYISPSGSTPYVSTNGISTAVTPASGADGSAGWYRLETRLPNLGSHVDTINGDYIKLVTYTYGRTPYKQAAALEHYGWQFEERFGASRFQRVRGIFPAMSEGGIAGDSFLGCYPSTSGTRFAILSSLTGLTYGGSNVLASGIYPTYTGFVAGERASNYFNASSIRSMDQNGFVKAHYPFKGHGDPNTGYTNPASGLIVSAAPNFSSTGEVSCICTIASADAGLANMYGGLFKAGLWTIDLEKTLSTVDPNGETRPVPSFPLKFTAGYNRLVYRLFAEKNFNKNITSVKDHNDTPGCKSHTDLTLIWKLNFLL